MNNNNLLKKYLLTTLVVFTLVFMVLIFGPTEIFFGNYKELGFVYGEFGWKFLYIGIGISLIVSLIISLFPRILHKGVLGLVVGVIVAAYVQTMFLNNSLGQIGVTAEGYIPDTMTAVMNATIWGAIILLSVTVAYHRKVNERKIFTIIVGVLLAVQAVGYGTLFLSADKAAFEYPESELCLNMEEQLTVSGNENIIVILFDNVSNVWLEMAKVEYDDLWDCVKDFTYYENADCNYYGTYPSIVHVLTGKPLDVSLSVNDYLAECWDNPLTNSYYDFFAEMDYKVNVFTYETDIITGGNSLEILEGKVANVTECNDMVSVDYPLLYETMLYMSLYRYMPDGLKHEFYVSNEQYVKIVTYEENQMLYSNPNFYNGLLKQGLNIDDKSNYFVFNHLNGCHEFINDENCQYADSPTREQTIKGMFVLVAEYLEQLKEAGVYDDSTIIIMTDHGASYNAQPMFMIKQKYEVHDTIVRTNAPITYDEFVPTIVESLGGNYSDYGQTIYDIGENELRERVFYERAKSEGYPEVDFYDGIRTGGANIWKKYVYTGDRYAIWEAYENNAYEVIPMVDSYY